MSVRVSRMKLGAALAAACAVALVIVPAGMAALAKPVPGTPCNSSAVDQLPAFSWAAASGAAQYEFQIANDANFASVSSNSNWDILTKNTRAALTRTLPNGVYYWRVRGLGASGGIGTWSTTCQFQMNWIDAPKQESPTDGQALVYPTPLLFNWDASTGARSYRLQVSSSLDMSNPVIDVNSTNATQYSPANRLPSGTYYWTVQPIDAEGNFGMTSPVHSFSWTWAAGSTVLAVTDIDPSGDVYDPQFSWTPIQGAARYQLQVASATSNAADPWGAPAYDNNGIVSTTYTLINPLPSDTYYWRVRAIDSSGNSGPWVQYPTTDTNDPYYPNGTFTVAYATGGVANLRMIDAQGNDVAGPNPTVTTPIVAWEPTAGASSYRVNVGVWSGTSCAYNGWNLTTANDTWTPLASSWGGTQIGSLGPSLDSASLTPGYTYCVRVAPIQAGINTGAWSYLGGIQQPAFTFSDYPANVTCTSPCNPNLTIGAANYGNPVIISSSSLPLLSWNPIEGAQGYVVVVATNNTFQTILDEAFTRLPVFAPRTLYAGASRNYSYAIVPTLGVDGSGTAPDATTADPQPFTLPSSSPSLVAPSDAAVATSEPTFQWQPVYGADGYNVAVSSDPTFPSSGATQTYFTRATAYTPTSLPNATTLYWRVQGSFQGRGMSFSSTRSFQFLPTVPNFTGITNPTSC